MGKYIETGTTKGKTNWIRDNLGGKIVSQNMAKDLVATKCVIVVVDNGPFEAAAWAFSPAEFEAFTYPDDHRPKQFVVIDGAKKDQAEGKSNPTWFYFSIR